MGKWKYIDPSEWKIDRFPESVETTISVVLSPSKSENRILPFISPEKSIGQPSNILPEILISKYAVPFYFGGTSLLIVVNVTMDTVAQIHSHLIAQQYEGLIKKSKLRGRMQW